MNENISKMNPVAKMGFVPRGIYDNAAAYGFLDFVYYNGNTYVAKKLTVGNEPQENSEYWQILAKGGIEDVGIQFQEAEKRQNIQSGEDTPTLFGKIKKWYTDLKPVAWSGNYDDLDGILEVSKGGTGETTKEGAIKSLIESTVVGTDIPHDEDWYLSQWAGGSNSQPINQTPVRRKMSSLWGYVKSKIATQTLTTMEQIDANTNADNIAGATAIKSLKSDLTNSLNQINSNLAIVNSTGLTKIGAVPWKDIIITNSGRNAVVFFSNWTGEKCFPENYGSGIILPCTDVSQKRILYIGQSGKLYTGFLFATDKNNITWYS